MAELAIAFVDERCNALAPTAAALARDLGGPAVEASAVGRNPDARVLPGALTALREIGLDTSELAPAPASRSRLEAADAVVAIGLDADEVTVLEGLEPETWSVANPQGGQLVAFREARDELGLRVRELLRGS